MDPTYKGLPTPLPTVQGRRGPNLRLVLIIAGAFLLLITVLGLIFSAGNGSSTEQNQRLLYRLDALLTLTKNAQDQLKDDSLKKLNAELSLVLTGDQTAVTKVIPTAKNSSSLTAIKTEETDADTTAKLKTAASNGTYNSTYKSVMQDKLSSLYSLSATVGKSSASSKTKAALATMNEHLTVYFNQLKDLN